MVLQWGGSIHATNDSVQNADQDSARTQLDAFFALAADENPDLLITPEYSTPWSSVRRILNGEVGPSPGALWIMGCESITPNELEELTHEFEAIEWIFDPVTTIAEKNFVDPACLVMNGTRQDGTPILVVAVQFKECIELCSC